MSMTYLNYSNQIFLYKKPYLHITLITFRNISNFVTKIVDVLDNNAIVYTFEITYTIWKTLKYNVKYIYMYTHL